MADPTARPPLDSAVKATIRDQALAHIQAGRICMLSSQSADGYPMLRGMGYLNDGWTIFMSTIRGMAKEREIAADPRVASIWHDQAIRRDHFIQLHGVAREVVGDELEAWQQRRFVKYPHEIEQYDATARPWIGWVIEPVRLRTLGYVKERAFWGENPVVFGRRELGLAPLHQARPAVRGMTEWTYQLAEMAPEVAFWDALGVPRVKPAPGEPLGRYVVYDMGGPRLQLHATGMTRERPASSEAAAEKLMLQVTDLDNALEAATTHGGHVVTGTITLEATATAPRHRYAYVSTPAGQLIGLVEGGPVQEATYRAALGMRPKPDYWSLPLPSP